MYVLAVLQYCSSEINSIMFFMYVCVILLSKGKDVCSIIYFYIYMQS